LPGVVQPLHPQSLGSHAASPEQPFQDPSYQEPQQANQYASPYAAPSYAPEFAAASAPYTVQQPEAPALPLGADQPFVQPSEGFAEAPGAPVFAQHSVADTAAAQLSYAGPAAGGQAFVDPAAPPHHTYDSAAPQVLYAEPSAPQVLYSESPAPQVLYAEPSAPQVLYSESPAPQILYSESPAPGQLYADPVYADTAFGYPQADHAQYAPAGQAQPYGQAQDQSYGRQQDGSPFAGYAGPQSTPHVAEQPPSFEAGFEPVSGVDGPAGAFDGGIDAREQQLAQAYQQAQTYQQHGQPFADAGQTYQQHAQPAAPATGPLPKIPDYYNSPLGHPQGPEPATYADQTLRFDPYQADPYQGDALSGPHTHDYQGDALSGPHTQEEPIDPTAIYAPDRSPVKHEEGVGTEQVGHATDSTLHWYGSDR
jgi:hypothetical protein